VEVARLPDVGCLSSGRHLTKSPCNNTGLSSQRGDRAKLKYRGRRHRLIASCSASTGFALSSNSTVPKSLANSFVGSLHQAYRWSWKELIDSSKDESLPLPICKKLT
jgi:hypothetical protein